MLLAAGAPSARLGDPQDTHGRVYWIAIGFGL